jgi:membrane protease YdiL (CAAX protease family)
MNLEPNPYQTQPQALESPIPIAAIPPIAVTNTKPRLWTVFVTLITATALYLIASVVSVIVMIVLQSVSSDTSELPDIEVMLAEFSQHPAALWVLVMPGQLAILVVTVVATLLSPEKFAQRLSLRTPRWPLWVTIAATLAAPLVSLIWSIPLSFIVTSSEHLESMMALFRASGQGFGIIGLFLCVSILPAIAEEWLFRGYIQSRLLKRWHPAWAILLSSLLFAGFHMDPVHVVAVIPLGLWLGLMTYYSGSLIPAMIAHAYNNALSIIATVYLGTDTLNTSFVSVENVIVLASGIPGILLTLAWVVFRNKEESQPKLAA